MTRSPTRGDRGSALVLSLAVVAALGVTTSALLQASGVALRRERSAWSSLVSLSDAQSVALVLVHDLTLQPAASCAVLTARPRPALDNGSAVTVSCSGGPPQPWSVTVSAAHGPRRSIVALVIRTGTDGVPRVHSRSVVTGPSPALTSAA